MALLILFLVCTICFSMENLKNVKAIIFDFGGTLDLDGVHWLNAFYLLYEKFSLPVDQASIKKVFYEADKHLERLPNRTQLTLESMIRAHVRFQFEMHGIDFPEVEDSMCRELCSTIRENFGKNRELLKWLKSRYKLGLVSNFYGNVEALCKEAGFEPFLDVIIDSGIVDLRKPDPAIFQLALKLLEEKPERAVFVGDSFCQDIKPAKEIGMKTIWLKTNHTAPYPGNWKEFVDVEIDTLKKLKEIFL